MVPRTPDRRPGWPRALSTTAGLLLLLATTLAMPQLHEAFHAPGAPESECPVHLLQVGFSLVLVGFVARSLLGTRFMSHAIATIAPSPRVAHRTPAAPRAPPHHSFLSS
ncbi:MAG TPA: hypothetical protein DGN59_02175 [Candidatus Latescibacteria bacterium]|nr:hypothetical protein [Candidatus Latescibacterota bacterium]